MTVVSPLRANFTPLWSSPGLLEFWGYKVVTTFSTMQINLGVLCSMKWLVMTLFTRVYDGNNPCSHTKALMLYLFLLLCSMKGLVMTPVWLVSIIFYFLTLHFIRNWAGGFPNPNDMGIFLLFFTMKLINKKSVHQIISQGIEASLIFLWFLFLRQFHHRPVELHPRLMYHCQILIKSIQDSICMDFRKEPDRTSEAFYLNHQSLGSHFSC